MGLQTQDLIEILAQAPVKKPFLPIAHALFLIFLTAAIVTMLVLGLRPEIKVGMLPPGFWIKTLVLALLMMISSFELSDGSQPVPRRVKQWPTYFVAGFLAVLVVKEWHKVGSDAIMSYFFLPNFYGCLIFVTLYGLLGSVALIFLLRQYAPFDLSRCAAAIGFAAASSGALGYSIHCPLDSPTFIVVAYGIPVAVLSSLARMVLPRFIAW